MRLLLHINLGSDPTSAQSAIHYSQRTTSTTSENHTMPGTTLTTFRYIDIKNGGNGVDMYPTIRTEDGTAVLWDGRANAGTYWLIQQGENKKVDPRLDKNSNGYTIFPHNIQSGQKYRIGINVVWGDDDWYMGDDLFQFDENSSVTIKFHKYGGLRDGNLAYDGTDN